MKNKSMTDVIDPKYKDMMEKIARGKLSLDTDKWHRKRREALQQNHITRRKKTFERMAEENMEEKRELDWYMKRKTSERMAEKNTGEKRELEWYTADNQGVFVVYKKQM